MGVVATGSEIEPVPIPGANRSHVMIAHEIAEEGVIVEETGGTERLLPADTVILAIPRRARQQLLSDLEFVCDELYVIDDAVKPCSMHNAIPEGYLIGIRI